jgi:Protein of unknown function (DUF3467)
MPTKRKKTSSETQSTSIIPTQAAAPNPASTVEPVAVLAPDFKLIYTNFVQASFTPLDCSLILGEALGVENGRFTVQNKARVTMSPTEAKIVARLLLNTVRSYEKQFGEITVPDSMMPPEA